MLFFFKITDHEAEENKEKREIIREDISEIETLRGDWALVKYVHVKFPGEIVNIIANEFEVNVIYKSGNTF